MIQRPTAISVIGWVAVVLGALMTLSALGGLAVSSVMPSSAEFPKDPAVPFPTWLFDHYTALCLVQLGLAATMMAAGAAILRLRPWARPVLEVFGWILALCILAFGV